MKNSFYGLLICAVFTLSSLSSTSYAVDKCTDVLGKSFDRRSFLSFGARTKPRQEEKQDDPVEKQNVISKIKHQLADSKSSSEILSYFNFLALQALRSNKAVALLVNDVGPEKHQDKISSFANKLLKDGYLIVYDADSSFAQQIQQMAGTRAVGITAHLEKQNYDQNVFCIPNIFLRFEAFRMAKKLFVTRSSIVGVAAMIDRAADVIIDDEHANGYELATWRAEIDKMNRNLGLKFEPPAISVEENKLMELSKIEEKKDKKEKTKEEKIAAPVLEKFSLDTLKEALRNHEFMATQEPIVRDLGGAVIYGSARFDRASIAANYDSAYFLSKLGSPITTGGAGGAMEVANTGAYDAGGFSIGIPIGGRNQLKMESRVASDVQTNTIITTGYKERLPLLGNHKELIIVLPGGGGTMREIAMALIKMRDEPTSTFQLIFMDVKYYKGLLKWLYAQNIPEFILSRIHIIDNSNELKPLINALLDYRKIDANKLFSQPKPDGPRSDRTSFRIKPRYYIEDFIQKIINAFKRIGF